MQRNARAAAVEEGLIIDEEEAPRTLAQRMRAKPGDTVLIRVAPDLLERIEPAAFLPAREARIDALRDETGVALPTPGIVEDAGLDEGGVEIEIDGVRVLAGTVPESMVAARLERDAPKLIGIDARPMETAWPLAPAMWVDERDADVVEEAGFDTVPVGEMLIEATASHLRRYAGQLVSYDVVQGMWFAACRTSTPSSPIR